MQQEKRIQEKLQLQLAGDFVDDIVGHTLFRLDVDLAGLDAHFMGGAVVGLCGSMTSVMLYWLVPNST